MTIRGGRVGRGWYVLYAVILTAAALVFWLGLPFAEDRVIVWREDRVLVLAGTILLAVATFLHVAAESSLRDACLLLATVVSVSWAAEVCGMRWGVPFGYPYRYHAALVPRLPGDVPLFIPLAWFCLARPPLIFLRWLSHLDAEGRPAWTPLARKSLACAVFLASCGLVLDPLGVVLGAWVWGHPGHYFGMPLPNVAGWAAVGLAVYPVFFGWQRAPRGREPSWVFCVDAQAVAVCSAFLALAYAAAARRLDSLVPVFVSAIVLGPYWVYWIVSALRRRKAGGEGSAAGKPALRGRCHVR